MPVTATTRLMGVVLIGSAVGVAAIVWINTLIGILVWVAAVHLLFVVSGWVALWPLDPVATRRNARREDFNPAVEELLVLLISLGGLLSVAILLVLGGSGIDKVAAAIALFGVFLAWGSLHLMYAARYAALFYQTLDGSGIDFNSQEPPAYRDFFYFSYNLGMTYQVSDTNVTHTKMRAVVLRHCLLSYVFVAVVLASAVNVVAGIAGG